MCQSLALRGCYMIEASGHLRGQYLIAFDRNKLNECFLSDFEQQVVWNGYTIFADDILQINQATSETVRILLIGYTVHHEYNAFSNENLLSWMLLNGQNVDDLIRLLQDCGGRYIALIEDKERTVAVTDCCAMRQLYWYSDGGNLILSSSARLILDVLDQKPVLDKITSELLASKVFSSTENAWYGNKWYDNRINKVIANHYLDMRTTSVHRIKYYYNGPIRYDDIIDYAENILTGLIRAAHSRYQIIQPLTAGYDSRLLLAASKKLCNKTRYYVFGNNNNLSRSPDVKIAIDICRKVGLDLEIALPGKLREDFLASYQKKCFFTRILPKTAHIQWHYYSHRNNNILNINGNCIGVVKCVYQNKARGGDDLGSLIKITGCKQIFAPQIEMWYSDAIDYCRNNNFNVFDLFYWEQRMSNWGALYAFEQDMAIEELSPYNHKNLLLALLKTDYIKRKSPQRLIYKDLINRLWPETLSLPFNPIIGLQMKSRLKSGFKRLWELAG